MSILILIVLFKRPVNGEVRYSIRMVRRLMLCWQRLRAVEGSAILLFVSALKIILLGIK